MEMIYDAWLLTAFILLSSSLWNTQALTSVRLWVLVCARARAFTLVCMHAPVIFTSYVSIHSEPETFISG